METSINGFIEFTDDTHSVVINTINIGSFAIFNKDSHYLLNIYCRQGGNIHLDYASPAQRDAAYGRLKEKVGLE